MVVVMKKNTLIGLSYFQVIYSLSKSFLMSLGLVS